MNAIYSFWSKPYQLNNNKVHGCVSDEFFKLSWSLSVNLAKKYFHKVKLITDISGLELLSALNLPLDEISLSLEDIPEWINLGCWAYGKILAYQMQTDPFVHLDYDAYLFNQLPIQIRESQIIIQNKVNLGFNSPYTSIDKKLKAFGYDDQYQLEKFNYEYNCGIFGGSNLYFIKAYCNEALKIAKFASLNNDFWKSLTKMEAKLFPCIFEQHNLAAMLCDYKVTPFEIASGDYGFTHVWGDKNRKNFTKKIELTLKNLFPQVHTALNINIDNLIYEGQNEAVQDQR